MDFGTFGSCVLSTTLVCCALAAGMKGWADGLNACLNGEGCLGCLLGWPCGLTIGCINCSLPCCTGAACEPGARGCNSGDCVWGATGDCLNACWFAAGGCPCTTFCCSVLYKLFECADVPVDAGDVCCSGDFCAHGKDLPGDEPVPCELSTIFSSMLDDPHVAGPDAVDGAAGWMGLNESDLWGTMPDVVAMGD